MDTLIPPTSVPFDGTDPLIALLSWGLVATIRRYAPKTWVTTLRRVAPVLAVLLAVFLRVTVDQLMGQPLTWDVALRALAAGAVAVLGHSQLRELAKALPPPPETGKKAASPRAPRGR